MTPINQPLYARLRELYGYVHIANQGEPHVGRALYDERTGRKKWNIIQPGEYYCVSCPICARKYEKACYSYAQKLWINHTWGVREPTTGSERWWLAHCFRNSCTTDSNWLRQLKTEVYKAKSLRGVKLPAVTKLPEIKPVQLPQEYTPLNKLPEHHIAHGYMRQRGFDPDLLARCWPVGYCDEAAHWQFQSRIVIPVWQDNQLRSWQTRLPYDATEYVRPKYLSGPRLHQWVYGLDAARPVTARHWILVEGVPSVWRIGPGAIALFGKTASAAQLDAIAKSAGSRRIEITLDGVSDSGCDTADSAQKIERELRARGVRAGVIHLPPGKQPDELARTGELWKYVAYPVER